MKHAYAPQHLPTILMHTQLISKYLASGRPSCSRRELVASTVVRSPEGNTWFEAAGYIPNGSLLNGVAVEIIQAGTEENGYVFSIGDGDYVVPLQPGRSWKAFNQMVSSPLSILLTRPGDPEGVAKARITAWYTTYGAHDDEGANLD